mmetsp:Transcript_1429/g.2217  ORF Transcript_1429/g.2217 Transcript_1429/m.2217 type:complete len:131 (+) Transcript_1429:1139-1531(+)
MLSFLKVANATPSHTTPHRARPWNPAKDRAIHSTRQCVHARSLSSSGAEEPARATQAQAPVTWSSTFIFRRSRIRYPGTRKHLVPQEVGEELVQVDHSCYMEEHMELVERWEPVRLAALVPESVSNSTQA